MASCPEKHDDIECTVRASDRCALCSDLLMSKPFYVFSCGHRFHSDCLAEAVLPHLQPSRQKRLLELQTQLELLLSGTDSASLDSKATQPSKLDTVSDICWDGNRNSQIHITSS